MERREPTIEDRPLPRHIAIIMDGNGRWAAEQGLPRIEGHREGARSVREIVRSAREMGIKALTLFAFSEQNWDRPTGEVDALMELLLRYVLEERAEIMGNDIRLTAIGALQRLPDFVRVPLQALIDASAKQEGMTLCLALSYGAREDIVSAARGLAAEVLEKKLRFEDIDEDRLAMRLSSSALPPLDLLIRTSGELRVSNFLLWELAYAELYFSEAMWPDFRRPDLNNAITAYRTRERRFGRTSDQLH